MVVRGETWGAIVVATFGDAEPCPPGTEARLAQFADLVGTAIANADARDEVMRLAEEQAALRSLATLVAEGRRPQAVFDAATAGMQRVLGADNAALSRYEPGPEATVVPTAGLRRHSSCRGPACPSATTG